ncbi:AAA family ATPase [Flavobacterium bizetiae]|uniref:AAA family ATPase n=1 Tax=Flavobacterium bizetiae TaxID=2704140 RepID=UPI003756EA9B
MLDLVKVHDEIYLFLIEQRKKNSELRFTFRKSNHANRLEDGYWFYGNEGYLAISFWEGMDWKNRTPNISFIINNIGNCWLEVNVSDSILKKEFIEKYFLQRTLNLEKVGRRYISNYNSGYSSSNKLKYDINDYMSVFKYFLETDKENIDDVINRHSDFFTYRESNENIISFINSEEFLKRHNKIRQYRKLKDELKSEDDFVIKEDKPGKLFSINIKDYGLIENISLEINSKKSQWVFLTGENGSGKTNLLRAIATTLGNRMLSRKELEENPNFEANVEFTFQNEVKSYERLVNGDVKGKRRPYVQGLAMYGPYRLDLVINKITKIKFNKELNKEESFKSLFKTGTSLLSIDKQFEFWRTGSKREQELFQKREYYIKSLIIDVVDNLVDIRFAQEKNKKITKYFFNNNLNQEYSLTWDELSTGTKSTIAMLGDILIRLFDQQRDIFDPAELRGIVIIDEIDLHLHPKAQKDIVINLSKTFPNIQFIVSTHSPIPFIGAPKESIFIIVERDFGKAIKATKLDIDISDLLPNTILSSPIFGFNSLINVKHNPSEILRTENDYQEAAFYKILDRKIKERKIELGIDDDSINK